MAKIELRGYELVNKLKRTRRRINLTSTEQALYHELVSICNESDWSEIFDCSNDELRRALLISENTLIAARLSLINAGLIFYKSGKSKRKFGEYSFTKKLTTTSTVAVDVEVDAEVVTGVVAEVVASDYNKHKPNSKPNQTSEGKPSAPKSSSKKNKKKEVEATEYWQPLVKTWFEFYTANPGKGEEPTFEGEAPKSLKKICERLKKRTEAKNIAWNEITACDTLSKFLHYAFGLKWLTDNFLLPNLERQYDKIVNQNGNGTTKNGQPDLGDYEKQLASRLAGNASQS